jgi:LmbE family N-acetylglucosaminyl deacetylase
MERVLVMAPHPDDETLGCGGTLLRHSASSDELHWLIGTRMHTGLGVTEKRIAERSAEIDQVAARYQFSSVHQLDFPAAALDQAPLSELVSAIKNVMREVQPSILYLPYKYDAHSDHGTLFQAATACCKWFRQPSLKEILVYETPSETGFQLDPEFPTFVPVQYVNIAEYFDEKISIMEEYAGEMSEFPFPRSARAIACLAEMRGTECGATAAEAFMILRRRIG